MFIIKELRIIAFSTNKKLTKQSISVKNDGRFWQKQKLEVISFSRSFPELYAMDGGVFVPYDFEVSLGCANGVTRLVGLFY